MKNILKAIVSIVMVLTMICTSCIFVFAAESDDDIVFTTSYNPFATVGSNSRDIIGSDDRVIINNTDDYPYSAIAYLDFYYTCGCRGDGTGFMVSECCMLAAGHCIVCSIHDEAAYSVTAYFGYSSTSNCLLVATATVNDSVIYYDPQYLNSNYNNDYDYGYVVFDTNVGNTTGWFGLAGINDSGLDGLPIQVAGYVGTVLYKSSGEITSLTDARIKYDADMVDGQSGCPVYANFATLGYMAVGINTDGTNLFNWKNSGWRITSDFIDELADLGYVTKVS